MPNIRKSENKGLKVYRFKDGSILTDTYGSTDTVQVATLPGLIILLEQVFTE